MLSQNQARCNFQSFQKTASVEKNTIILTKHKKRTTEEEPYFLPCAK